MNRVVTQFTIFNSTKFYCTKVLICWYNTYYFFKSLLLFFSFLFLAESTVKLGPSHIITLFCLVVSWILTCVHLC